VAPAANDTLSASGVTDARPALCIRPRYRSAAVALAVKEPDPLAHAEPRDAVTELIDNSGAIAVGYHTGKFKRAIAAGAAADIGGIDPGGLQPDPDFARPAIGVETSPRSAHRAGTGSLIPNGLHSQRARKCAAIEQDVLPGDVACLAPQRNAQACRIPRDRRKRPAGFELGAFGQQLVDRDAALLGVNLRDRAAQAVVSINVTINGLLP